MFSLSFLYEVLCKLRACKNARNIKETQNSSRVVSHLCISFCEPTKQHSLPRGINFIDFLHMNRSFLKTAVTLKGRSTEFRRMDFLYAESQRIKWLHQESHCRPAQNPSDLFREAKKKEKAMCQQGMIKDISLLFSTMLPPHCWCLLCSQQLSSKPSALTVSEYAFHFVTPRNPHHSTGIHYARWYLNASRKRTPAKKKKTKKTKKAHTKHMPVPNSLLLSRTPFLWMPPCSCEEHDLHLRV